MKPHLPYRPPESRKVDDLPLTLRDYGTGQDYHPLCHGCGFNTSSDESSEIRLCNTSFCGDRDSTGDGTLEAKIDVAEASITSHTAAITTFQNIVSNTFDSSGGFAADVTRNVNVSDLISRLSDDDLVALDERIRKAKAKKCDETLHQDIGDIDVDDTDQGAFG